MDIDLEASTSEKQSKIVGYFTGKFPNLLDHIWSVYYQWKESNTGNLCTTRYYSETCIYDHLYPNTTTADFFLMWPLFFSGTTLMGPSFSLKM